jgi:hypothetical protein
MNGSTITTAQEGVKLILGYARHGWPPPPPGCSRCSRFAGGKLVKVCRTRS